MVSEDKKWFILNHFETLPAPRRQTAQTCIDRFNSAGGCQLELFAPTFVKAVNINGRQIKREQPLTFHYVFVRGTLDEIKRLCGLSNGFSFVLNRSSEERYATVDDKRMDDFKAIARAYSNSLPFFALDDIDLEAGDKVEIVEGSFPGLVGYYMPKAKSTSGDIILSVTQNLGTVVYDVKAKYVRVLEFSKKSRRSYDQIDAFIPRLLQALRHYHEGVVLSDKEKSDITLFVRRMSVVKIDNHKLDAKLQAILIAANHLLGDSAAEAEARRRHSRHSDSITSTWTKALVDLILGIIDKNIGLIKNNLSILNNTEIYSKYNTLIYTEYLFYSKR